MDWPGSEAASPGRSRASIAAGSCAASWRPGRPLVPEPTTTELSSSTWPRPAPSRTARASRWRRSATTAPRSTTTWPSSSASSTSCARDRPPAVSITEEIERLGEQTASILVVAHDQAHETARLAQEQADRCIADAASNAVAITEQAKQQLRELDSETDSVWHERRRLIEDVRTTATALFALAEDAIDRFPEDADRLADEPGATVESGVVPAED